jgi:hypothetical protein
MVLAPVLPLPSGPLWGEGGVRGHRPTVGEGRVREEIALFTAPWVADPGTP